MGTELRSRGVGLTLFSPPPPFVAVSHPKLMKIWCAGIEGFNVNLRWTPYISLRQLYYLKIHVRVSEKKTLCVDLLTPVGSIIPGSRLCLNLWSLDSPIKLSSWSINLLGLIYVHETRSAKCGLKRVCGCGRILPEINYLFTKATAHYTVSKWDCLLTAFSERGRSQMAQIHTC